MITSGLILHTCVGAMLIMNPNKGKNQTIKNTDEFETENSDLEVEASFTISNPTKEMKYEKGPKLMTVAILSNSHFMLLMVSSIMFQIGTGVVLTHTMAFAESQGISSSIGNMMISLIGVSSLVGRFSLGILSQLPLISTIVLYFVAIFLCGNIQF